MYENVYRGQTVDAFDAWCFDAARKPGDNAIVKTEFGYHLMYYIGQDVPYWQIQVKSTLVNEDYAVLLEDYEARYELKQHNFGLNMTGTK